MGNSIYFEIYKSQTDYKYYWRLRKITNYADEIIATGGQSYKTIEEAEKDINIVKSAIPSTPIRKSIY